MGNNKEHGTASATQIAEIFSAFMKAIATVINDFSAKEIINAVKNDGEKLTGIMWLVFTALVTGQVLALNPEPKPEFATWRTIRLGTHKTIQSLIEAIKKAGCHIASGSLNIMSKVQFSEVETEIELIRVSVANLGFKKSANIKDIFAKAFEFGLMLCPSEVGPQLRLEYTDQPCGEWLIVAMEAISDSGGGSHLFDVICFDDASMSLRTRYDDSGFVYNLAIMFVFARACK